MHTLPTRTPRLRRFTWLALLAWVFAVAAGAANACLAAAPATALPGHELHRHGHEPDPEPEPEPDDAGKAGCLKFCDDESSALAKNGVAGSDLLPACPPRESFTITPRLNSVVVGRLSRERPRSQGPPLVIRLLRLTL